MARLTLVDTQTAGISGDMLLAAMIDAGAHIPLIVSALDLIPTYFSKCREIRLKTKEATTHGFRGLQAEFEIVEDTHDTQATELLQAAKNISSAAELSDRARTFALGSLETLVRIESRLHHSDLGHTHLHEAGSADTLADVFSVAIACDDLGIFEGQVYGTPIAVGKGKVSFSHGTMSNPAPATLEILKEKQLPLITGPEDSEMATPTGVSMLANLVSMPELDPPPLVPEKIGYGAGHRELVSAPNILRVVIGREVQEDLPGDRVDVIETNLDDVSGETLGYTLNRLIESGAKDVWISEATFKKNRPGHVLHLLCEPLMLEPLAKILFEETGTLGVRYTEWDRFKLNREIKRFKVEVFGRLYEVNFKIARDESAQILAVKPEFDDVERIALASSKPAREVAEVLARELRKTFGEENEKRLEASKTANED